MFFSFLSKQNQYSSTKLQTNFKSQYSMTKTVSFVPFLVSKHVWDFEFQSL